MQQEDGGYEDRDGKQYPLKEIQDLFRDHLGGIGVEDQRQKTNDGA